MKEKFRFMFVCMLLGLAYVVFGLLQILTFGLIHFKGIPDYTYFIEKEVKAGVYTL